MKYIIAAFLFMGAFVANGQSVVPLRGDTIKIYKAGGYAELVVQNRTKDSLGLMVNVGNGQTKFIRAKKLDNTHIIIGLDTLVVGSGSGGGIDSIRRKAGTDSIFAYSGGVPVYSFKDSASLATILASLGYVPLAISDTSQAGLISSRYFRQKGLDSLAVVFNALFVRKIDSAGTGYTTFARTTKIIDSLNLLIVARLRIIDSAGGGYLTFARAYKIADSLGLLISRKVNIADTAGGGYATFNRLKKVADSLGLLISGAGGSQTFPQVLATGRTLSAADSILLGGVDLYLKGGRLKADTVRVGSTFNFENTPASDTICFLGTSITFGTGPTNNWYRYSTAATRLLAPCGFFELNLGVSGSTAATQTANVPIKTAGRRWLNIEFGSNELNATLDSATYRVNLKKLIDTAVARGWSGSQMSIVSQMGSQLNVVGTTAQQRGYNYVDSTLALQYGAVYIDAYNPELLPGYSYIYSTPLLHPNNDQSYVLANIVAGGISSGLQYKYQHQRAILKDTIQADALILKNLKYIPAGTLVGRDSVGNIGNITQLPPDIATQGRMWLNGALVQRGAGFPTYDTTRDIVLNGNTRIWAALPADPTNVYADFRPFNTSSGETYFHNSFEGGAINFYRSNAVRGSKVLALGIPASGALNFAPGATMSLGSGISAVGASGTGLFTPLNSSGNSQFKNSFSTGELEIFLSNGATNASTKNWSFQASGDLQYQVGGTFTDITQAVLNLSSTTKGILITRMTVAQRDAITVGQVTTLTASSGGSGYTTGAYTSVSLTGGSGSGLVASVNVAAGVVGTVTITSMGTGYKIGDVLSVTAASVGGTGSGFATVVTAILTNGLQIYNLTTRKPNWYDGTGWKAAADSAYVDAAAAAAVSAFVSAGKFLATTSNQTNIASLTIDSMVYSKVGNAVHCKLSGAWTGTSAAASNFDVTVPVTNVTWNSGMDATGTWWDTTTGTTVGVIGFFASATTIRMRLNLPSTNAGNFCIQITYDAQ